MILAIQIVLILILASITFAYLSLSYAWLKGAPTVYASDQAIRDCLETAGLEPGETVLDLGCGDARSLLIAAREFGAKGIGVEASLYCYLLARWQVWRAGQTQFVQIIWRSLQHSADLVQRADVVYAYLYPQMMPAVATLFAAQTKSPRLVSLAFPLPERPPRLIKSTRTLGRATSIYLYRD